MFEIFRKEKLLALSNVVVITVTLLIIGVFVILGALTQTAIKKLENQAQVTVFFKDEVPESVILQKAEELAKDERIKSVNYVSKEEAFQLFSELNKEDPVLLESVSASILPASLEVSTKNLANLGILAEELNQVDGVEEIKFFRDVIDNFKTSRNVVYTVGLVLILLFTLISFSLIVVTIRLSINSKGTELEILKLVGASNEYVQKPLIRQTLLFALVSGTIASFILIFGVTILKFNVFRVFSSNVELTSDISLDVLLFTVITCVLLYLFGLGLAYIASIRAIKRYLQY